METTCEMDGTGEGDIRGKVHIKQPVRMPPVYQGHRDFVGLGWQGWFKG